MKSFLTSRLFAITVAAFSLVALLLYLTIPLFVDHNAVKDHVQNALSEHFGQAVLIRTSSTSFGFSPSVTLKDILIKNNPQASADKFATVAAIEVQFSLWSVFDEQVKASDITIHNALLELEEFAPSQFNTPSFDGVSDMLSHYLVTPNITFVNSRINYTPYKANVLYKIRNIDAELSVSTSGTLDLDGIFYANKKQYSIVADGTSVTKPGHMMALDINAVVSQGEDSISFKGATGREKQKFYLNGTVSAGINNVAHWLEFIDEKARQDDLYDAFQQQTLHGDVVLHAKGDALSFLTQSLKLNNASLNAKGQLSFKDKTKFRINAAIQSINLTPSPEDQTSAYEADQLNSLLQKALPSGSTGKLQLKIASLKYGDIEAKDIAFNGTLLNKEFIINQAVTNMAGDTQMLLFGILKRDANSKVHLDGNIEVVGKDIQTFMSALELDEHKLLSNHSGAFRAKSNVYFSAGSSTISEMRFQAGDFLLQGGIQYQSDKTPEYTMSLRSQGGKLDSLMRYVNPTNAGGLLENNYNAPRITLPWLTGMKHSYKITLIADKFELFNNLGNRSRFVIAIAKDKMALTSVDLNVQDMRFTGDVSIDQSANIPYIDADFYLSEFDASNMVAGEIRQYPVPRDNVLSIWDDTPLNLDFLKGYSGKFLIRLDRITHPSFTIKDVAIDAVNNESAWTINRFDGNIWNGRTNIKGVLDVSSIATTKLEFRFKNIRLHEFLSSTVGLKSIRGSINMNGRIDTGGVSMNSLIDNLSANIVLVGNNIVVQGFDMAGLIQALPSVRSNSEVANMVRVALIGGQTTFRTVEGAFHIIDGQMKTHGMTLRSRHAIGAMKGVSNLLTWTMNHAIKFRLPTIAMSGFPEITLYFRQSMDNPLIQVDTRALESFMAQRRLNR